MTEATSATAILRTRGLIRLVWILPAGAALSAALGVSANEHDPTDASSSTPSFTSPFQQLSDGTVRAAFPDVDDEIERVTRGRSGMPAFGPDLSASDVRRVVEDTHTR
jgi:hypothetical protein